MIKVFCDKCGKEIINYEQVWEIKQIGDYGSSFDGERLHKQFCDECLSKFIEENSG